MREQNTYSLVHVLLKACIPYSRNTPHRLKYKHFLWIKMNYELQYLLARCWVWSGMYPIQYVWCARNMYNNRRHNPYQAWTGNTNKWRNLHRNVNGIYLAYGCDRYQSSCLSINGIGLVNIHGHLVLKLIFDTNCNMSFTNTFAMMFKDIISFTSSAITNMCTTQKQLAGIAFLSSQNCNIYL